MANKLLLCILFLVNLILSPAHSESIFPKNFSQSELKFAQGTVGAVIASGGDHVYPIKVAKGQMFNLTMNSGGARAYVALFSPSKKEIGIIHDLEGKKVLYHEVKEGGTYYIVCYSGPTFHTYDFIVRVD